MAAKLMTIAVLGGDLRQIRLIELLVKDHYHVKAFGFENVVFPKEVESLNDLRKENLQDVDVIIGPIPCSHDGMNLNTKYLGRKISLAYIFENIPSGKLFIVGKVDAYIEKLSLNRNVRILDILNREELAIFNAIPTAEGAIQIAMENMETTIHGSKVLILGYGRIGKILGKMLLGIGADVMIEARKNHDLAWIEAYGFKSLHLKDLKNFIGQFDLIYNTIPYMVIDIEVLEHVKKDALIIDLSSQPGGVDFSYAKEANIKAMLCLSLPGKVAPITAAKIIKETIFNIYEEMGVSI